MICNYRPQTKFAKVVFTGVCLSTGGVLPLVSEECLPPPLGKHYPSPRQTPFLPGRPPPKQTPPCPVHVGMHTPCPVHAGIWSTSGQYVSHWNAFLLHEIVSEWLFLDKFIMNLFQLQSRDCFCTKIKQGVKTPSMLRGTDIPLQKHCPFWRHYRGVLRPACATNIKNALLLEREQPINHTELIRT